MVLTRSQYASGSPIKPLTPCKRKERQECNRVRSNDDESSVKTGDGKKSLADHLETICEEDENIVAADKHDGAAQKKKWCAHTKQIEHRFPKKPLKIPSTIDEETAEEPCAGNDDAEGEHVDSVIVNDCVFSKGDVKIGDENVKLSEASLASCTCQIGDDDVESHGALSSSKIYQSAHLDPRCIPENNEIEAVEKQFQCSLSCHRDTAGVKAANNDLISRSKHDLKRGCAEDGGNEKECAKSRSKHRFYFPPPNALMQATEMETSIDVGTGMPDTYIDVKGTKEGKQKMKKLFCEVTVERKGSHIKDSIITSDFERNLIGPDEKTSKQKWRERKLEREATAGKDWFNLKPPEMTTDIKRDLEILQMRSVLDPKRFYKHNDRKVLPKYFQVGRVLDSAADFYSSRVPRKERRTNLAEELLADAEFQRYQKRKYNEIQAQKKSRFLRTSKSKRRKFSSKPEDSG